MLSFLVGAQPIIWKGDTLLISRVLHLKKECSREKCEVAPPFGETWIRHTPLRVLNSRDRIYIANLLTETIPQVILIRTHHTKLHVREIHRVFGVSISL